MSIHVLYKSKLNEERVDKKENVNFLHAAKLSLRFAHFQHDRADMKNCVQSLSLLENKDKLSGTSQRHKIVISAIHLPSRRRFGHCHFLKFTVNVLTFQNEHNKHNNAGAELKFG